jgi:hypothetical protein
MTRLDRRATIASAPAAPSSPAGRARSRVHELGIQGPGSAPSRGPCYTGDPDPISDPAGAEPRAADNRWSRLVLGGDEIELLEHGEQQARHAVRRESDLGRDFALRAVLHVAHVQDATL